MAKFRTYYDDQQAHYSAATALDFTVPDDDSADYHPSRSLTSTADAEALDINNIVDRYLKTGHVPSSRLHLS